ncbi:MAG: nucleotidyltransferase family protein [Planctomycetota bacterium]|nr:MAG: nucleotidyltransferase family protein [Planctomycetota bacterium]
MRAVFLAAGFATRMFPLTRDRAKPLLEVGGEPLLGRLLRQAAAIGIEEAVVVVNARFAAAFRAWAAAAGPRPVLRLVVNRARRPEEARGAVADLALGLAEAFPDPEPEGFLVAAGDNLLGFGLEEAAARFRRRRRPLILVREVPEPVPPRTYSEVVIGADGTVASFREKPTDPRSRLSAIAVYFLPPELPHLVRSYLDEGGPRDAPGHFLAWLCSRTAVEALPVPGPWFDVGSLEGYRAVRDRLPPD